MNEPHSLVGETLDGKYRIDAELGRGGMGAVFRATHLGTERTVALKVLAPRLAGEAEFLERFRREAKAAGRLRHPNIVDITDFGVAEARGAALAYLVMEYLDGQTLGALLAENPKLPLPFVVEVVEQVASALAEAHGRGILHRDLKPENLWLEPDRRGGWRVKVLDFGLAKTLEPARVARDEAASETAPGPQALPGEAPTEALAQAASGPALTQAGTLLGTPAYMSPEQCRGGGLDVRSDVYSLAVIVHQMLAGRPLFSGTSQDLLAQHLQARPPELRALRPDLSRAVARVVMDALAKDPEERPVGAAAFAKAFAAFAQGPGQLIQRALGLGLERCADVLRLSLRTHRSLFIATGLLIALAAAGRGPAGWWPLPAWPGWLCWAGWMVAFAHCQNLTWASMPPLVLLALAAPLRPALGARMSAVYGLRLKALIRWLGLVSVLAAGATLGLLWLAMRLALRTEPEPLALAAFLAPIGGAILLLLGPGRRLLGSILFVSQERLLRGSTTTAALARSRDLQRVFQNLRDLGFPLLVGGILTFAFAAFWCTYPSEARSPLAQAAGALACTLAAVLIDPFLSILGALLHLRACGALGESPEELAARFEGEVGVNAPGSPGGWTAPPSRPSR